MATFLERVVGDEDSIGSPNWQKPPHIIEAIAKARQRRSKKESRSDDCGRTGDGKFGPKNDCASEDGPVESEAKAGKKRNVDVMIGGGKRVAVMDEEAKARAIADFKSHPKPEGSAAGSTTDLWEREFAVRESGSNKISKVDPVFPKESLRQNGQYVAHEAVAQYLSMRHEAERIAAGASGPAGIIDLNDPEVSDGEIGYVADALAEDASHAYEVLQVDPGFYSGDLEKTMATMTRRHPELDGDENAKFVFTALLAITSSGQGPDANLADADGLYRMWKEHGTVVPSSYGGGSRDVTTSLRNLQSLIDSFGVDRTRRLLSGYAPASKVAKVFRSLAEKSGDPNWRERTGSSELTLQKPLQVTGELKDEVIPLFSVFGPKIGSFYANLTGKHDFLTMDRWLMRSVGRVTGDLVTRSTPEQARARARSILDAIDSGKWKKSYLFGTDASHGITKEALVRSLKIQEKTGVIEESGAAFLWATAAERSHQKTKRPTGGGYGRHEDDTIHALHQAGNSLFKSLIHEQQDPRTGTARSKIREVFRRVQEKVEKSSGRKPDIDEIQAALWQYEKRLWKHLGAKTNIEDNSLFSSAADGISSGRIPARRYSPSDRRSSDSAETVDDTYDTYHFDEEQAAWTSDFAESGVDIVDLMTELGSDDDESRNFAALDYGSPIRSAVASFAAGFAAAFGFESRTDCGRDEGGRFGAGNDCAKDEGGGQIESQSSTEITSGKQWKKADGLTVYRGKEIPAKSLSGARSVGIIHGKLLSKTLRQMGVSLEDAAKACAPSVPGSEVSICHGTLEDAAKFIDSPEDHPDPQDAVTFFSKVDVGDIRNGVAVGTTLMRGDYDGNDDDLVLRYEMFSVSPQAKGASPVRIARALMREVSNGISAAEDIGVSKIRMFAAGSSKEDDDFRGYRIWPRLGFDGKIPRELITPRWSVATGLFNSYGSSIPNKILSPRALKEKRAGSLTIQALYETKEGQDWWEANGGAMSMSLMVGDKKSPGWQRFVKVRERHGSRSLSDSEFFELLDVEWRSIREEAEQRAFCPTGDGGGIDNSCGDTAGSSVDQFPKSFPSGSEKFRDAVDSVAPSPERIWDRSKGRAETPSPEVMDRAASEQETSGKTLTPEAEASYADLVEEIGKQYESLVAAGLTVKAWRGEGEPYGDPPGSTKPNSDKMRAEVAKTGEFSFFMTENGFGTGAATPDHPMLRETKYKTADGEPMIANDLFRVVHDMVAHVRGGYSFSTNGEYNGMLTHASTLPESAWPALFAETFGQNAVYEKTGKYAGQNAYASKIGPQIIRDELAKRGKKSVRAGDAGDADEPLGYQHIKVRPWLMAGVAESRGDAKAPPKDRIRGSDVNDEGSAKNQSGDITLDEKTITALKAKAEEHNKAMQERNRPGWTHVRLPALKSVYRRGAGAFSASHRPGMTRDRWAMARVNAFLHLARSGRPENPKYVGDNDLLNSDHPRHSGQSRAFCPTGAGGGIDNSCSASDGNSPSLAASSRISHADLADAVSEDGSSSESVSDSLALLDSPRRFELIGTVRKGLPRDPRAAGDYAAKVIASAETRSKPLPGHFVDTIADKIIQSLEDSSEDEVRGEDSRVNAACLIASMAAAAAEYPEMADCPLAAGNAQDIFDAVVSDGVSNVTDAVKTSQNAAAFYSAIDDKIVINTDGASGYAESVMQSAAVSRSKAFYSTSRLSHVVVHEDAHRIHYQAIRTQLGIGLGRKASRDEAMAIASELGKRRRDLLSYVRSGPDGMAMIKKVVKVSGYASSSPVEFVAEYFTALRLGVASRDAQLDKAMELMGFPTDKLPSGKKKAGRRKK